jgi:hypothetical protein
MTHVFSIFGFPLVIVSDNGPVFRSNLQGQMANFFGFRHVPILPYNAAANGTAEASVKRIKLLLDRHTKDYDEWHRVLPLAQLQLNSHVHTGTDMSPYMALFGRAPHGIAQLENPALLSKTGSGSDWLKSVRSTFLRMHSDIQKASDELKKARAAEANARTSSELDPRAGQIKPGGWARIMKGSMKEAKYLRKHASRPCAQAIECSPPLQPSAEPPSRTKTYPARATLYPPASHLDQTESLTSSTKPSQQ